MRSCRWLRWKGQLRSQLHDSGGAGRRFSTVRAVLKRTRCRLELRRRDKQHTKHAFWEVGVGVGYWTTSPICMPPVATSLDLADCERHFFICTICTSPLMHAFHCIAIEKRSNPLPFVRPPFIPSTMYYSIRYPSTIYPVAIIPLPSILYYTIPILNA
jgi:hypothetical protein